MKIKLGILLILTFLITACSSDDLAIEQKTLSKAEEKAITKLITTNLSIEKSTKVTIESTKLKKIDGNYYLMSYHGGERTATLLRLEGKITLKYAGISCTSKSCAYDDGCLPNKDGKKCTKCPWSSDCTKTVTSDVFTQ